jgi:hypothetical protein
MAFIARAAGQGEQREGHDKVAGEPRRDERESEHRPCGVHGAVPVEPVSEAREEQRTPRRADPDAGHEGAVPARPRTKHAIGVNRQHGREAEPEDAEGGRQDRERPRLRTAEDVAQAFPETRRAAARHLCARIGRSHAPEHDEHRHIADGVQEEARRDPDGRDQDSCHGGADYPGR